MGPARMIVKSLTSRPGIREQNLPEATKLQRSKIASYSITSSALASKSGGTVRPSVLAVLRLMTN